jgi:RNA polymerase primary sigma factor
MKKQNGSFDVIGRRKAFQNHNEVLELFYAYKNGSQFAGNELIRGNMGIVFKIARTYLKLGLSFNDLVQEGLVGFAKALKRYDPGRAKLSTYATYWIRAEIISAVRLESCAHPGFSVPITEFRRTYHVRRAIAELSSENTDEPTPDMILAQIQTHDAKLCGDMTRADVERCLRITGTVTSLDETVYHDNTNTTHLDLVPDETAITSESHVMVLRDYEEFLEYFQTLTEFEKRVIKGRFGLYGEPPLTLQVLAGQNNLSRERIRQVQERALQKLDYTGYELDSLLEAREIVCSRATT